jgi:glycosyltransferase involved in cell wall biosynthesis
MSDQPRPRIILAGAAPGANAGNAVSSEVLFEALQSVADTSILSHRVSPFPTWHAAGNGSVRHMVLGTQPFSIHGEAFLAGFIHRSKLHSWQGAWVVNSRYASSLRAAGVPYIIWEATTARDELNASSLQDVRRSRTGTGVGNIIHRLLLPIGERLEGLLYRDAVAVVAMSEYTRDRILARHSLAPDRVRVLPHPTSRSFARALKTRSLNNGPHRTLDDACWRLLFVGRVDDPRKNFDLLLDALRRLVAAGEKVRLTVVGAHNEAWRSALDLGGIHKAVKFTGAVSIDQLADAYLSHDLLVVPSRQEGFGIVVAEAFSAGLPVVATRCGGPEHTIVASGGGVLVNHSAAELSAAVVELMRNSDRRCGMREKALAYAGSVLAFEPFARRVGEITDQMLESHFTAHE